MGRRPPQIELSFPISRELFRRIVQAVRKKGYAAAREWSENVKPPGTATELAAEAIYVICNSGMSTRAAVPIFERCMAALRVGDSASSVFGHKEKAAAIAHALLRRVDRNRFKRP